MGLARKTAMSAASRYSEFGKEELLARIAAQWAEWNALVERAADHLTTPGVEGMWSVKDVIAHICQGERWMVS
jgi:hypothetical protein